MSPYIVVRRLAFLFGHLRALIHVVNLSHNTRAIIKAIRMTINMKTMTMKIIVVPLKAYSKKRWLFTLYSLE